MSANIRQCKDCGMIFQSLGDSVCPDCRESRDGAFIKVRDYIYGHPSANLMDISAATGVAERLILEFLKEDRLSISGGAGLVCENCKKPILSGRYCGICRERLGRAFGAARDVYAPPKNETKRNAYEKSKMDYPMRGTESMHLKFGEDK